MGDTDTPCGYIHQLEEVPVDFSPVRCTREPWPETNTGRCIWHADVEEKPLDALKEVRLAEPERIDSPVLSGSVLDSTLSFTGCILPSAKFNNVTCHSVEFAETFLWDADFSEADCWSATFRDANLWEADLPGADLRRVDLSGADLWKADLSGANLEDTVLDRTDLRNANLQGARLYQAVLATSRINEATQFGDYCVYETDSTIEIEDEETHRLQAAAWVYHQLESIHENAALSTQAQRYHIRAEEAKRQYHLQQKRMGKYGVSTINRYLTLHGESLKHIILWSVGIIFSAGILYPLVGGVEDGDTVYQITSISQLPTAEGVATLARGMYFSIITFTTIGYANVAPHGTGSRILVGIQSLLGAIFVALFVFVLGRQVAR